MALNQLAPDIQEALLNLTATNGKPEIHEKRLRPITAMLRWEDQRETWREIAGILRSQEMLDSRDASTVESKNDRVP